MLKVGATSALLALFLSGCAYTGSSHDQTSGSRFHAASLSSGHIGTRNLGMERSLETIRRGDTLLKVIERAGGGTDFYYGMTIHQQRRLSSMHPGDVYEVMVDARGQVARLAKQLPSGKWLAAERIGQDILMSEQDMVSQYSEHLVTGNLKYDMKGDLISQGIPRAIIDQSLEIMSSKIDVGKTYNPGDTFSVIYHQPMLDGHSVGDPYVTSIKYRHDRKDYFAFRHKTVNGSVGYYDETGGSLGGSWIKKPVESYSRISSQFNPHRRHPITGRVRPHNGVDFAAPTGTPIYAASTGVINFAGSNGGFGNYVAIDHPGNIETRYAHMSKVASGIRSGSRVSTGDLIGYVGSTGLSTGPHLHYEMWVNGVAIDPMKENLQVAGTLYGRELHRFMASRDTIKPLMLSGSDYVAIHDGRNNRG